jgi:MarR family transcriptional regulator, negative regulator of the multidrug operon emrRAB
MTRLRTANMLAAFAGEVTERVEATLKSHPNQTDSAAAALNIMGFWEGITNAQLARALKLSHTATVRLVDKLEAQGFVEARAGDDRRATHLFLTSAGRKALQPALVARCAAVKNYLGALTAAEERQFAHLLEKLMRPLAQDAYGVSHFCRLCEFTACPGDECPMHANMESWPEI